VAFAVNALVLSKERADRRASAKKESWKHAMPALLESESKLGCVRD
jgi:hypothetical protein